MPSVNFNVTWPDGEQVTYYSPSTIIHEHIKPQTHYSQQEFADCIALALNQASERVYQRFGYYCSSAQGELEKIQHKMQQLKNNSVSGQVLVNQLT